MIDERIFSLKPVKIFCPICGTWHKWEGKSLYYYSEYDKYEYRCYDSGVSITIWTDGEEMHVESTEICAEVGKIISDCEIEYDEGPCIKFEVPIRMSNKIDRERCRNSNCRYYHMTDKLCYLSTICDNGKCKQLWYDVYELMLEFKIQFEEEEFYRYAPSKQRQKEEMREAVKKEQPEKHEEKKEDTNMAGTIWKQLYEHSPKENVELVKRLAEKYKGTLKWAVPVVSIYGAYRILNKKDSQLTIDNVSGKCQEALGFTFDNLKDKKLLTELMTLGGLSAGAYAAVKAVSAIQANKGEISMDEIEDGLEKIDGVSKKFAWIQPKTEKLLPVAVSVITVYLMTQEPVWFVKVKEKVGQYAGNISIKASLYVDMIKLFAADKLQVDLEEQKEVQKFKKFALLAAIVGIAVFLYGKNILRAKEDSEQADGKKNEKLKAFIAQVTSAMEKLMPSTFAGISTYLLSKKIIEANEQEQEEEFEEEGVDIEENLDKE